MTLPYIHKVFVKKTEEYMVLKTINNEAHSKTEFQAYDDLINSILLQNKDAIMYKLENIDCAIVGCIYVSENSISKIVDSKFKSSSYINAINGEIEAEEIIKSGSSLSFNQNKVFN